MHMTDCLLSPAAGAAMFAVSAGAVAYSVVKVKKAGIDTRKMAVAGVAGACVLAAQMVNYAIPGTGSSGHIIGAVMLAALTGAAPAMLVMASVLMIQCFVFADGGMLALGANIFNLGVIPCLIVYPLIFKPLVKNGLSFGKTTIASFAAAIVSLQLGAFGVVLITQVSGITALPFIDFALAMQPIHFAIGLIDGAAAAAVLYLVHRARPEIMTGAVNDTAIAAAPVRKVIAAFAAAALIFGLVMPRFGSSAPDGLERSIEKVTESAAVEVDSSVIGG
jgi:cobalt/nickel transport system permease protein